jgi:hypothetical protein
MIKEDLPQGMKADLLNMLKEPKYIECFMVKTPMVKLRKNHKTQILFATLFFFMIFAQIFIIIPSKYHHFKLCRSEVRIFRFFDWLSFACACFFLYNGKLQRPGPFEARVPVHGTTLQSASL